MDLRLPYIVAEFKNSNEAELFLHEWKINKYIGTINFSTCTVSINNYYCDRFEKYEICLALADDSVIHYYLRDKDLISEREFRDYFDRLYHFYFKAQGKYEIHAIGDDLIIEVYDDEQEAEDRASYFTEYDPDGEKYEVIVRGNPYERYN